MIGDEDTGPYHKLPHRPTHRCQHCDLKRRKRDKHWRLTDGGLVCPQCYRDRYMPKKD